MKDDKNHLFIHLNLCIALALGIVVFIGGIENATTTEVPMYMFYKSLLIIGYEFLQESCKVVAALLQYFFTSAFCWMLCEGIMLYMMLVTVFGNRLNNRHFFFILGWGKHSNYTYLIQISQIYFYRASHSHSCHFSWTNP